MRSDFATSVVFFLSLTASASYAADSALDATRKIAGKYTGQWIMYGVKDGKVVEKMTWDDVLVASNPTETKERATVEVRDVMTFPDGTTRTTEFTEGYFSNADGSAGERFFEVQGKVTTFKKLTDHDWAFQTTPDQGELQFLGFNPKNVVSASHVTTKTTTYDGTLDTDHVTRVTTVQWKDAGGSVQCVQFTSMKGEHTRVAK